MTIDRRMLLAAITATTATASIAGAQSDAGSAGATAGPPAWPPAGSIPLWPGRPPGAPATLLVPAPLIEGAPGHAELHMRGVAAPGLTVYRPARPNGIGLLTMPGGGYAFLSVENEGIDLARYFAARGITVFVLTYRLPAEGWTNRAHAPLQDAQRAMRLIRARAGSFGVDPAKLGIIGFSAGGHLAADLAVAHDAPVYRPIDSADRQSAKPAFVGLGYAVTSLEGSETHIGSRDRLLGPSPAPALVAERSPLLHIGPATPPCFAFAALDDTTVPPACTIDWMQACRAARVPVEAHLFEQGGHGFGLHLPDTNPGALWPEMFHRWIGDHTA